MERKLYRSRRERMVSGVCGGIAEYFEVDPTLIRLLAVVLMLVSFGAAAIAYVVMSIVVPEQPASGDAGQPEVPTVPGTPVPPAQQYQTPPAPPQAPPPPVPPPRRHRGGITFGIVLVLVGLALLASQFVPGLEFWRLWPLIIVAIGVRTMLRGGDS